MPTRQTARAGWPQASFFVECGLQVASLCLITRTPWPPVQTAPLRVHTTVTCTSPGCRHTTAVKASCFVSWPMIFKPAPVCVCSCEEWREKKSADSRRETMPETVEKRPLSRNNFSREKQIKFLLSFLSFLFKMATSGSPMLYKYFTRTMWISQLLPINLRDSFNFVPCPRHPREKDVRQKRSESPTNIKWLRAIPCRLDTSSSQVARQPKPEVRLGSIIVLFVEARQR